MESEDEIPILIEANPAAEPEFSRRVPITLICGFLGAGKSTFLKWILTERHGYRIAVIMNEFGDTTDIEAKALNITSPDNYGNARGQTSEEFLELANGCLCCSIKDSGIAAIEQLMRRKGAFDYILLETTGLADPGPIAAMFWQNEEFAMGLGKDIYLDGVICVVDALFFDKQIKEDTSSQDHSIFIDYVDAIASPRQIAGADVILLNKSDLVSEPDLIKTESQLHQINPSVPVYRTVRGHIDLIKVMGIDAYGDRSRQFLQKLACTMPDRRQDSSDDGHDQNHDHKEHMGISSIVVPIPEPLTGTQVVLLEEWIRNALWEKSITPNEDSEHRAKLSLSLTASTRALSIHGSSEEPPNDPQSNLEILRCKGIWWNVHGEQFLLQGVRTMYEISKFQLEQRDQAGKVVLIGKGLCSKVENSLAEVVGSSNKPRV